MSEVITAVEEQKSGHSRGLIDGTGRELRNCVATATVRKIVQIRRTGIERNSDEMFWRRREHMSEVITAVEEQKSEHSLGFLDATQIVRAIVERNSEDTFHRERIRRSRDTAVIEERWSGRNLDIIGGTERLGRANRGAIVDKKARHKIAVKENRQNLSFATALAR